MDKKGFMVAFLVSTFLSIATFATPDSSALTAGNSFCAQTFNVYAPAYASGISGRLDRLAQEIQADPCDLIQFQEFWREGDYNNFKQDLKSSQYTLIRADDLRRDKLMIGLSSAITGKILQAQSSVFAVNNQGGIMDGIRDAAGVQKGYTLMNVITGNSPTLLMVNLHTHPDKEHVRLAQVTQLIKDMVNHPEILDNPIVLTADLNATPESPELDLLKSLLLLRDSYIEANSRYGNVCTYCDSNPLHWGSGSRVIDYILIGNSWRHQLGTTSSTINLKGIAGSPLSDHYGVRSILNWNQQQFLELNLLDPLVDARVTKARQSINRAIKILVVQSGKGFREATNLLRNWENEFASGRLNPGFEKIFRTP